MRSDVLRENLEILRCFQGAHHKQMGHALGISDNTVKNHVNSIIEKLEVSDLPRPQRQQFREGDHDRRITSASEAAPLDFGGRWPSSRIAYMDYRPATAEE